MFLICILELQLLFKFSCIQSNLTVNIRFFLIAFKSKFQLHSNISGCYNFFHEAINIHWYAFVVLLVVLISYYSYIIKKSIFGYICEYNNIVDCVFNDFTCIHN